MSLTESPRPTPVIKPAARIFCGISSKERPEKPSPLLKQLPAAPPWRQFSGPKPQVTEEPPRSKVDRGAGYVAGEREITAVNLALFLRRPLLITGRPGAGKTTLAHAVARELGLGTVFTWPITSRSTLQQGLYHYDAVARLQDAARPGEPGQGKAATADADIGRYLRLGPLGAAFALSQGGRPRVLLIDEIDKGDIDLPNDLLHVFEEGNFEIPELSRLPEEARYQRISVGIPGGGKVEVERGWIQCPEFPVVFLTSNGERDFPPAFVRRCVRLDLAPPKDEMEARQELTRIVAARLGEEVAQRTPIQKLIAQFQKDRDSGRRQLANDQLLNAASVILNGVLPADHPDFQHLILRDLADTGS